MNKMARAYLTVVALVIVEKDFAMNIGCYRRAGFYILGIRGKKTFIYLVQIFPQFSKLSLQTIDILIDRFLPIVF